LEHASDTSSSAVRAAALDAATALLDNPQSHAVLRALLPPLGNLIHDKAETVRLAAVRLLQRVKQVRGIRFYHVVPVDHLTARLAEEGRLHHSPGNTVASALTALLLNSYMPQGANVSATDQLKRTMTFLTTDSRAAAVFYANIAEHLSVEAVAKFTAMLFTCLSSAVKTELATQKAKQANTKKRRRYGRQDAEEEEEVEQGDVVEEDQALSAANTPLMASLAETICAMWESIESQLLKPDHQSSNDLLLQSFSGVDLTNLLAHFEQKAAESDNGHDDEQSSKRADCLRTCAAILSCAGRLPQDAVDGIVPHISSTLASLSDEDVGMNSSRRHVSAHIALLCVWGMTDEVASSLASSIESAFGNESALSSPWSEDDSGNKKTRASSSRHSRNSSEKIIVPSIPSIIAWAALEDILQGSDPTSVATRESILSSPVACSSIENALQRGTNYAERLLTAADTVCYSQ
jgi:condensin-2 complex subunit G2